MDERQETQRHQLSQERISRRRGILGRRRQLPLRPQQPIQRMNNLQGDRLQIIRNRIRYALKQNERVFNDIALRRGVPQNILGWIRSLGDSFLFGGNNTRRMKRRLQFNNMDTPLANFSQVIIIAAKNLATAITNYKIEENNLRGVNDIEREHVSSNLFVRHLLRRRQITPENLAPNLQETTGDEQGFDRNFQEAQRLHNVKGATQNLALALTITQNLPPLLPEQNNINISGPQRNNLNYVKTEVYQTLGISPATNHQVFINQNNPSTRRTFL